MVPLHIKLRRKIKNLADKILKYFSTPAKEIVIDKDIDNILVIRINYRIGNILFTTPFINELQKNFPKAKIDILVGAPFTKVLFDNFENVDRVLDFDRKLLKQPLKTLSYIKEFRAKRYDVVFNLNNGSSSDRIATLIANSKYKVSFCNEDSYTPVNVCVRRKDTNIVHEALKPLELLKVFGIKPDYKQILTIKLSQDEIYRAKEELSKLVDINKKIVGIFRDARYEKKFDDNFWLELIEKLKQKEDILFIDILAPGDKNSILDIFYSEKNLRKVASFMANLDAFICADTGPMHLASASGVKTIALFKVTPPKLYGTLKENDLSLVVDNIDNISNKILNHLR